MEEFLVRNSRNLKGEKYLFGRNYCNKGRSPGVPSHEMSLGTFYKMCNKTSVRCKKVKKN
jgi:hypothetical protein